MPHGEVVHPAPQDGINMMHHPADWLGVEAPERLLELAQQRRSLLEPRRVVRPPQSPQTADAAEVKPQESEAVPLRQVHDPPLLLVDPDVELCPLLSNPFLP